MGKQEIADDDVKPVVEDVVGDGVVEGEVIEEVLDDDGNPVVPVKEPWQLTEEEEEPEGDVAGVPVDTHIKMKQKLKGRLKDRDAELETLKLENAELKKGTATVKPTKLGARPKEEDFPTDEAYDQAMDEWDDVRLDAKLAARGAKSEKSKAQTRYNETVTKAVDDHYERSAQLVADSGISSDHFKSADRSVREAVEAIMPNKGDAITDNIISILGEGSEKVMFFVGRNKAAKATFQSLLAEDNTGSKALVYLGQQKERLTNPKRKTSSAPKPPSDAGGDTVVSQSEKALLKKYKAAHSAGKSQDAYNIKKKARAQKIDTAAW